MDYDRTDQAQRYDAARAMARDVQLGYLEPIARLLEGPATAVVDLGCGTGRFSLALAERFQAPVVGVDPARTMLAKARKNVRNARVRFIEGAAEAIPAERGTADLVFASMVWHHFTDPLVAAREIHRVLTPTGVLAVRNAFVDTLDEIEYVDFFPAARAINRERLPQRSALVRIAASAGFETAHHQVFDHVMAPDWGTYCDKVAARALSDLAVISDADFQSGIAAMRSERRQGPVVEPIDLFVFRKKGARGAL
jgi:ubiquinone/menaquinone biosynthesis C-methylase UbiE